MVFAILIICILIPSLIVGYEYLDEKEKESRK